MAASAGTRSVRGLAALIVAIVGFGFAAGEARAVAGLLETFRTSVDVRLDVTERSHWKGSRPGCFAPFEDFDVAYRLRVDSRPNGSKSTIKNGTATLTGGNYGVTPSYGDKRSFRQYSSGTNWDLTVQNPGDCTAASPVPAWATSPTCKRIEERVEATLIQSTKDDPNDPNRSIPSGDGSLVLIRTPKAAPTVHGRSIGASCLRTLHDVDPVGVDSNVAIELKSSLISVPIPRLDAKLNRLSSGSRRARPSFKVPIEISGDCIEMNMRPSIGAHPDFVRSPFTQPHQALGMFEAANSSCTISGRGVAIVRRESAVTGTLVPLP